MWETIPWNNRIHRLTIVGVMTQAGLMGYTLGTAAEVGRKENKSGNIKMADIGCCDRIELDG